MKHPLYQLHERVALTHGGMSITFDSTKVEEYNSSFDWPLEKWIDERLDGVFPMGLSVKVHESDSVEVHFGEVLFHIELKTQIGEVELILPYEAVTGISITGKEILTGEVSNYIFEPTPQNSHTFLSTTNTEVAMGDCVKTIRL